MIEYDAINDQGRPEALVVQAAAHSGSRITGNCSRTHCSSCVELVQRSDLSRDANIANDNVGMTEAVAIVFICVRIICESIIWDT